MASSSLTVPSAGVTRPAHAAWHRQLLLQPAIASSSRVGVGRPRLTAVPAIRASAVQSPSAAALAAAAPSQKTAQHPSTADIRFPTDVENPETWSAAQRAMVNRTIDLEGLDVSPKRRKELVEEMRRAGEAGMFYIKNLGVDEATMDDIRRLTKRYFELPLEEKVKNMVNVKLNARPVGYSFRFSTASTAAEAEAGHGPSYRQVFRYGRDTLAEIPNLWPPSLPEFRAKHLAYSAKIERAMEFVTSLMAEALGLPASYVTDQYGGLLTSGVMAHSPPQKVRMLAGQIAAMALPAHIDGNLFTFNVSTGARGLQYFLDGEWVTAPALLDAAVINIGDDMETLSNGRYHAPYHRVVMGAVDRVTILTSVEIGENEMVAPAAGLGPARYRTRRTADNLEQMVKNYQESRKPVRSKAYLMLDPESHLDRTKNLYEVDGVDYINGVRVADWGVTLD